MHALCWEIKGRNPADNLSLLGARLPANITVILRVASRAHSPQAKMEQQSSGQGHDHVSSFVSRFWKQSRLTLWTIKVCLEFKCCISYLWISFWKLAFTVLYCNNLECWWDAQIEFLRLLRLEKGKLLKRERNIGE